MRPASDLSGRLITAATREGVMRVLPFWADGGSGPDSALTPRGHVIAAYPTRVRQASLEDLSTTGLEPFLRSCLPTSPGALPLVVIALGFDAGRAAQGHATIAARPGRTRANDALPDVFVAEYAGYLAAQSECGPWISHGDTTLLEAALATEAELSSAVPALELGDPHDRERYFDGFNAIRDGIAAGDFYQVNLARRLEARFASTPSTTTLAFTARALHLALRTTQPAAFGALIPLSDDAWLVSGSPECLLQWDGKERVARSFPIKGTVARDASDMRDAALSEHLRGSIKDQAEHIMIVDLVRNDLGRVAIPGSVSVPALMRDLPLATVRHLVSEVRANVPVHIDLADVIGALFPGGSITGAPKIAAIQALDRHEPFDRGLYCGSLIVARGADSASASILIRSATVDARGVTYGTGGGLVADSIAAQEFAETELKASALAAALASMRT